MIKLSISIFLLFSTSAFSASCFKKLFHKTIDISQEFGPIRDQGDMGWCYSYAGADLLQHRLMQINSNYQVKEREEQISAVAMSLAYNQDSRYSSIQQNRRITKFKKLIAANSNYFHQQKIALQNVQSKLNGVLRRIGKQSSTEFQKQVEQYINLTQQCMKREQFKSCEGRPYNVLRTARQDPMFKSLELKLYAIKSHLIEYQDDLLFYQQHQEESVLEPEGGDTKSAIEMMLKYGICFERQIPSTLVTVDRKLTLRNILNDINRNILARDRSRRCSTAKYIKLVYPQLELDDILKVLRVEFDAINQYHHGHDPFAKFYTTSCHSSLNKDVGPLIRIEKKDKNTDQLFDSIDDILNAKQPVAISYYAKIFNTPVDKFVINSKDVLHASVIVGKEYNCKTGEEEYLIRNSYGKRACEQMHESLAHKVSYSLPRHMRLQQQRKDCDKNCMQLEFRSKQQVHCLNKCLDRYIAQADKQQAQLHYSCRHGLFVIGKKALAQTLQAVTFFQSHKPDTLLESDVEDY